MELSLTVHRNGIWFGAPSGQEMEFSFPQLIEHAAYSRRLSAGTVIGSGTVSNADYPAKGASCIAERRTAEMVDHGRIETDFMAFGERVRLEAFGADGISMFGAVDRKVVPVRM